MTAEEWATIVPAAVACLVALTAWLRAEVANKSAKAATAAVKTQPADKG
jgi:hypothetical protein